MKHGKKYTDSLKAFDRNNLFEASEALTPGTLTSRFAAQSSCPTAPARPSGS